MSARVIALVLASAVTAGLAGCARDLDSSLPGTVERDRIELIAESSEPIIERAVREGEKVAAGAVILRLDPSVATAQLDQARAEARAASARLLELTRGARSEEVEQARAQLERAQVEVDGARRELTRRKALVQRNLVSATEVDAEQTAVDSAEATRKQAAAALLELERGTRSEQIEQSRAASSQSEARVAELEVSLMRLTARAPEAAIVDALPYRLGERPPKSAPVAVLLADRMPYVRIYVPEPLRAQVTAGTRAEIAVDGVQGKFNGSVRYISSEAAYTPYYSLTARDRARLSFLTEVSLTDTAARDLPSGVPVVVRLEVGGARAAPRN
jgi:HlyD family secretion protein